MNSQPSTLNSQSALHLHIERLVVDAPVAGSVRPEMLRAHVEAELLRLLTESGLPAVGETATARRSGGSIPMAVESTPAQLGRQIAQATYSALNMAERSGAATESMRGTR